MLNLQIALLAKSFMAGALQFNFCTLPGCTPPLTDDIKEPMTRQVPTSPLASAQVAGQHVYPASKHVALHQVTMSQAL
jgi:hypothetical protein